MAAETRTRSRKVIFVDVALMHALLSTPAQAAHPRWESLPPILRGQLVEQLVGQQLAGLEPPSGDGPSLHFWHRSQGRPGEVDYVVPMGGRVVPIEIKSGTAGSMKSLHQFVFDKGLDLAVRIDANPPSVTEVDVRMTQGDPVRYRLVSIPPYLVWNLSAILEDVWATL